MRHFFPKTTCIKSCNKLANIFFSMMAFGLLFMLMGSMSAFAQTTTIYYVDKDATGNNNNGTSWSDAFNELQDIPESVSGSYEVWVAEGTYKPTTGDDQTASFNIPGNVTILGGFDGTETSADQRNWETNKTIVSGDLNNNGTADAGDSHTIATIVNSDNVTIDGFIIENSFADNDAENSPLAIGRAGAGIYVSGSDNLTINNCIFHHNIAEGNGTDSGVGGAIINFGDASTTTTITNTLFFENTATGGGGAISGESGSVEIISSTIADNIASQGGGIHFYNATVTATNSILTNNSGANGNMNDGGGSGSGTISYSMLYNIYGADGQLPDNITNGGNNIYETDPLYNSGGNIEGYRLLPESPAIDVGDNTGNSLDKDLAAENRIQDGDFNNTATIDLGAFEYYEYFSDVLDIADGIDRGSIDWGDYDNDGDLDILLTGWIGSKISRVYTNNGDGSFTELTAPNITLEGTYKSSVAWGDYDNDGDLDILLTGSNGGTFNTSGGIVEIYENNGNSTFTELPINNLTEVYDSSVDWGDYDNDGDLDILLTGRNRSEIVSKIYTNNGDGSFTELTAAGLTGVYNSSAAWGDYDNDGDLDILLTGDTGSGSTTKVYTNNGNGAFSELSTANLPAIHTGTVDWGDYDNDGDLDILLTGVDSGNTAISEIYRNNSNGSFSKLSTANLVGTYNGFAVWGDYDNDGDLDILLNGRNGGNVYTKIYINGGNHTFSELSTTNLPEVFQGAAAWGDYDNDGDLDILLTGIKSIVNGGGRVSKIYRNNNSISNTKPNAPTNPTATVNPNNTVTLSWDNATDNETPSAGLSYNVYIKENPVSSSIYAKTPMAQENDGWRKLPALGNAMQNTNYTYKLRDTYCFATDLSFKVQAIDHNYAGSEFSPEASFPIVLTTPPTTLYVNANAAGTRDGSSWADAYTSLTTAIDDINPCIDEIWVAAGTYNPGALETDSFTIPEGITLLGGFAGTETTADERNPAENPTILSGDLDGSGTANAGDSHTIITALEEDITIDGFTIEYAFADDETDDPQPYIGRTGGGIYARGADNLSINNSVFHNNTAEGDGTDDGVGGALINFEGTTTITNSLFFENTATDGGGGAISGESGTIDLINCTIANNMAAHGGGIHINNATVSAVNSIFTNNSGTNGNMNDDGGGGSGAIAYSILYNSTLENDGGIPTDITDGENNITYTDPIYNAIHTINGYRLTGNSLAINAGDNTAYTDAGGSLTADTDLAGNPRLDAVIVDMGAYEFQGAPTLVIPDDDNILYVNKNVSGSNETGDSWANALPELADALKWAREQYDDGSPGWDSDDPLQIWVAKGTYLPMYNAADGSYTTDGIRDNAFVLVPNVELYGGFDPGNEITDLSDDRIFPTTNPGEGTILSGDLDGNDNPNDFNNHSENTYHVVLVPHIVDSGLLDGITVQGGNGNGSSTVSIFDVLFSRFVGGGLLSRGTITVRNGRITQNRVGGSGVFGRGGGVFSGGSLTLRDVVVDENHSTGEGGGLTIDFGGSADLVNVLVAGNTAGQGAGLFISGSITLTNTTITENAAVANGGGLAIPFGTVEAFSSIVWGNTAPNGAEVFSDGSFTAGNSIVGGGIGGGLDEDPLFANSGSGNFTLQATSPAINTGDNGALPSGVTTDLAGNERIYNSGTVDMGAYEFQGDPETPLTLTVGEGWRMLSSPVAGQSYADMLAPLWTQGVPGSDYEGDSNTFPNVYTWDLSSGNTCLEGEECPEWIAPPTGFENAIPAGSGFLMYVFADDDYDEGTTEGFDKTLSLTGTRHSGDVSPDINSNPDGWTLVGNPYGQPVDFNELEKTDLTDAAYVYDPNLDLSPDDPGPVNGNGGAWRSIAGDYGDIPGGNIAPGQGFFVQTASDLTGTPSLAFSESDQTTDGDFYGKEKELRDFVRLEVQGEGLYNSAWIRFSSEGSLEQTTGEALELQPLDAGYTLLAVRKAGGTLMDIAHYPLDTKNLQIPLAMETTQSGAFTLSATEVDLPAGMSLYLYDSQTSQSMPITDSSFEYSFTIDEHAIPPYEGGTEGGVPHAQNQEHASLSAQAPKGQASRSTVIQPSDGSPMKAVATSSDRFLITTSPDGGGTELPNEVVLGQNYPNPFNPSTIISYQLPASSQVRLEVFDLIGRQVAVLVEGNVEAGRHQVNFNAEHLTSGVYLYRLQTDSKIITKKLTLIK